MKRKPTTCGTRGSGVGHAERFDAVGLPQVGIHIRDFEAVLSPAHVLLKSIGADCCVGNFGLDLFKQAAALKIDFGAMSLELVPAVRLICDESTPDP